MPTNFYANDTRPVADAGQVGPTAEQAEAPRQAKVDAANKAALDRIEAQRQATLAEQAEAEATRQRQKEEATAAADRAKALAVWQGTPAQFEAAWPAMHQEMLAARTADQLRAREQKTGSFYRGKF